MSTCPCSHHFSCGCDQTITKKQPVEVFILAHSLRGYGLFWRRRHDSRGSTETRMCSSLPHSPGKQETEIKEEVPLGCKSQGPTAVTHFLYQVGLNLLKGPHLLNQCYQLFSDQVFRCLSLPQTFHIQATRSVTSMTLCLCPPTSIC